MTTNTLPNWVVTVRSTETKQYRYRCGSLTEAVALVETVRTHWQECNITLVKIGNPATAGAA